jgi:hypothetical protein
MFILMISPGTRSLKWHKELRESQKIRPFTNTKQLRKIVL